MIYNGRIPRAISQTSYCRVEDFEGRCWWPSPCYLGVSWQGGGTFFEILHRLIQQISQYKEVLVVNGSFFQCLTLAIGDGSAYNNYSRSLAKLILSGEGRGEVDISNADETLRWNCNATSTLRFSFWSMESFYRNGYAEAVSNRLCSQYKFRPSDKYVPMMPRNMNIWIRERQKDKPEDD